MSIAVGRLDCASGIPLQSCPADARSRPPAGGLNYQIEHHLFPTLPRHNLRKVQQAVKGLCEKHGLVYEQCGMLMGTWKVCSGWLKQQDV